MLLSSNLNVTNYASFFNNNGFEYLTIHWNRYLLRERGSECTIEMMYSIWQSMDCKDRIIIHRAINHFHAREWAEYLTSDRWTIFHSHSLPCLSLFFCEFFWICFHPYFEYLLAVFLLHFRLIYFTSLGCLSVSNSLALPTCRHPFCLSIPFIHSLFVIFPENW